MAQSSSSTQPEPEARPLLFNQHASSSSVSREIKPIVERNRIPPPSSSADNARQEPTVDQFDSTAPEDEVKKVFALVLEDIRLLGNAIQKIDLYHATLDGNWQEAESIFKNSELRPTYPITSDKENVLHIAAGSQHSDFVEKLIHKMTEADMILPNKYKNTALCFAATSGLVRTAELLVKKNPNLPLIRGYGGVTPLFMAISYKRREMVAYLLSVTIFEKLKPEEQIGLFIATIHSEFYDIATDIWKKNESLATMRDSKDETALHVLARKPSAISSRDELSIWKKCIKGKYSKDVMKTVARKLVRSLWKYVIEKSQESKLLEFIKRPTGLLQDAAKAGNVEFLILRISSHPSIAWECDNDDKSIFHIAVENRLENVFNLIHEISVVKDFSTKYGKIGGIKYNMLHLAAKIATSNHLNRVSGAALQMQRELRWFKEVEKTVLPSQLEDKYENDDPKIKLTPRELFTEEHKQLRKDGEEWMKRTANSCMLVATLIATVVFAAAFTIPGGSDNNTGTPILLQDLWFTVFVISDVAAMFTSSSSILMFLSILTSRYAEDDFLYLLPSVLLLGLVLLFISIVCMVMAFCATFFMLYREANLYFPMAIMSMAIVPVICCAFLFKLWTDTFHNTYMSRFLFKPRQRESMFSSSTFLITDFFRQLHVSRNERDVENKEPKVSSAERLGAVTESHDTGLDRNFKFVTHMVLFKNKLLSRVKKVENEAVVPQCGTPSATEMP